MKADKIILGVLGGVAVGALLGVLFAPEKGDKTRKKTDQLILPDESETAEGVSLLPIEDLVRGGRGSLGWKRFRHAEHDEQHVEHGHYCRLKFPRFLLN